jgi:methylthioribose-1-phosphate isomerase
VADEAAPLRWEDGALLVLDQRRLPAEEAWVRCRTAAEVAECIRSMAVRGAGRCYEVSQADRSAH